MASPPADPSSFGHLSSCLSFLSLNSPVGHPVLTDLQRIPSSLPHRCQSTHLLRTAQSSSVLLDL